MLRGIFSLFEYCQANSFEFKINFVFPFRLEAFLLPNRYDWRIADKDLTYNRESAEFKFINSYSRMTEDLFIRFLHTKKENVQMHVYTNWTNHEEKFPELFNYLFKFSPLLEKHINAHLKDIGTEYISISFRFISLLGDFKDSYFAHEAKEEDKQRYIDKCVGFIKKTHEQHPQFKKILVTADSGVFLNAIKDISFVYIVKGDVVHMGYDKNFEGHLKTMIDFFLISKAEKVFCYTYGEMFKATKFSYTASLIGKKSFVHIKE